MPDPIDQNIPPVAPSPTMSDPQAMVDAALNTPTSTQPTPPPPDPTPTPTTPTTETPVVPAPIPTPTPDAPAVAMGDDTPLAFVEKPTVTATAQEGAQTTGETVPPNVGSSYLPPTPPSASGTNPVVDSPQKKSGSKITMLILGFVALLGVLGGVGYYGYALYGTADPVSIAAISSYTKEQCTGCSRPQDGGWLVWRDGQCKVSGICNSTAPGGDSKNTEDPAVQEIASLGKAACQTTTGAQWCESVDSKGTPYGFCMKNDGSQGSCNNRAVELGYTIMIGKVTCECLGENEDGSCQQWGGSPELLASIGQNTTLSAETKAQQLTEIYNQCKDGGNFTGAGTESFICAPGVTGACTALNGKPFTGNLNCFCGTVQVDTPNGHTSYSSTCGCNQTSTSPSPSPGSPDLACTGLTQAPVAPAIGDKVTFTCAGTITPTTAGTLTYKFRYSINNAAPTPMVNKTATTTELNISACGEYKVECQTCATIAGVLKCDPNWVGATQ